MIPVRHDDCRTACARTGTSSMTTCSIPDDDDDWQRAALDHGDRVVASFLAAAVGAD